MPAYPALRAIAAAAILALTLAGPARAADSTKPPIDLPKAYTAELESTGEGRSWTAKISTDGKNVRLEMNLPGGKSLITLVRQDKGVSQMLMPAAKKYIESTLKPDQLVSPAQFPQGQWQMTGKEKINGVDCEKWTVTSSQDDGAGGKTELTRLYYIDATKKVPVRMQMQGAHPATVDWKSLVAGAPDASVFELPEGYQKLSLSSSAPPMAPAPPK